MLAAAEVIRLPSPFCRPPKYSATIAAITARIAGGASMFSQLLPAGGVNMGERNVEATRRALEKAGIPIIAQDTGGDFGRSVYFSVADGRVVVRSLKRGELVL